MPRAASTEMPQMAQPPDCPTHQGPGGFHRIRRSLPRQGRAVSNICWDVGVSRSILLPSKEGWRRSGLKRSESQSKLSWSDWLRSHQNPLHPQSSGLVMGLLAGNLTVLVGLEVIDSKEQKQDIISFNSNSSSLLKRGNWHLQLTFSSEDSFLLPCS